MSSASVAASDDNLRRAMPAWTISIHNLFVSCSASCRESVGRLGSRLCRQVLVTTPHCYRILTTGILRWRRKIDQNWVPRAAAESLYHVTISWFTAQFHIELRWLFHQQQEIMVMVLAESHSTVGASAHLVFRLIWENIFQCVYSLGKRYDR